MRTGRLKWLVPAGLAVVVILCLLAAGSRSVRVRTASADVPDQGNLSALSAGEQVCEGPLVSDQSARSVAVWGAAGTTGAQLTIAVQDAATQQVLASGSIRTLPVQREWATRLTQLAPAGRALRVCVTDGSGVFALSGSTASAPGITATGAHGDQRFSLVLLDDGDHSLLGSLSTAFSRASLWRPSWVGPWTFWLLAAALVGTFGLAVLAVSRAAGEDAPPGHRTPPGGDRPHPDPAAPSPDDRSETSQDRPQPVS